MKKIILIAFSLCLGIYSTTVQAGGCKIFAAKLNFNTNSDDLMDTFMVYGTVSKAQVELDKSTGRSRGFGFVDMPNCEAARTAINELNGSELEGRTIVVKMAGSKSVNNQRTGNNRGSSNRGGGSYGGSGKKRGY